MRSIGKYGPVIATAIGLMAFAAPASAVTPQFSINAGKSLLASISGFQEGRATFLSLALNVEINCEEMELQGLILSGTDADMTFLYEGCTTLNINLLPIESEKEVPCHVSDVTTGHPASLHLTLAGVLVLPIEFSSGDFGVLAHVNGFVNFLSGTGCPLPLKSKISGSVCALIESSSNDNVEPLLLFSEAIQSSSGCKDTLLWGSWPVVIDGSAKMFLTGAHFGSTLGVLLL